MRLPSSHVTLERALSKLGLLSRTEARRAIQAARVAVDGRVQTDPLLPVVPERVELSLDGRPLQPPAALTVALHKPRGVVTTRSDPEGRPTVYELLRSIEQHLGPVGRLDLASSGLLLLTNDTRLASWLTDPENQVSRRYAVTVRGELDEAQAARLEQGLVLDREPLSARQVTIRKRSRRETHLLVELTEGKNREIRRLMEALGHEVTRLKRIAFGGIVLGDLAPGQWRPIPLDELERAFPRAPLTFRGPPGTTRQRGERSVGNR
jgi:23S rRNA pseudouridine2605 synthase